MPARKRRPLVGIAVDAAMNFGRAVMRGVMRYANVRRRWLLHEELRANSLALENWPECDGAVVGGASAAVMEFIRQRSRFVVSCSGATDPREMPVVCADSYAVGRLAAEHLLECRLEHFGYYGWHDQRVSMEREEGFRMALAQRGFSVSVSPVSWPQMYEWTSRKHREPLIEWLKSLPKPVGIFAVDDAAAHDLAAACLEAGIPVPDRVAIIGVNNDDLLCESAWPPLSSVQVDFSRVGYLAARQLDRLLEGETLDPSERMIRVPPLGVVRRMSTDVLAVEDPNLAAAVSFIREHACDPCTVQDVLRHVPVGRRWLERQFVRQLGRTPHDEIIRVRMEMARRLLLESDESLKEIAQRCGFSAVQNFTRAFHQVMGITPAAYRRAYLRGQS